MKTSVFLTSALLGVALALACGKGPERAAGPASPRADTGPSPATPAAAEPEASPEPAPEATPHPFVPAELLQLSQPWKGDLDGMVKRRLVRVLVPNSPLFYFVDRGREEGLFLEMIKELESQINQSQGKTLVRISLLPIPLSRDRLLPALMEGRGDIVAANLTVMPDRAKEVDFATPLAEGVKELVVTGPSTPPLASLEDLSGKEVFVRKSSSYAEHLEQLNTRFAKEGRPPVIVVAADENLETEDILEMVGAGLFPITIADRYLANFWSQIFPGLRIQPEIPLHEGGAIAWAIRKNSPKLHAQLDTFMKTHKAGTREGNVLFNKYLKSTQWVKNARDKGDIERFQVMARYFQRYAQQYDFDWLLMAAQGYQESQLDQSRRSHVGAIGVMQVLPSTARDRNVNIPDITTAENNIHAGIKYMRFIVNQYFAGQPIDRLNRTLFACASYNAGPAKVSRLRAQAKAQGLDPNVWFDNVEVVAAHDIGRETVQYVSNIFKYYVAYRFEAERRQMKTTSREQS